MFPKNKQESLQRSNNITVEKYIEMFNAQHGLCAICKNYETRKSKKGKITDLCVDHNHRNGKIRALLCNNCNRAIGIIEQFRTIVECISIFKAMTQYLLKYGD